MTVSNVFKHLKKRSRKTLGGPNKLPPGVKDAAIIIAKPLCHIINISWKTGIIPIDFKLRKITPVFKSGSKQEMDNYRPITVLPVCFKIMENVFITNLCNLLSLVTIKTETQKSQQHFCLIILEWIKIRPKWLLSKTFDTLSHTEIIERHSYRKEETKRTLFVNYLVDRKQTVCIGKETSAPESITCGVPQGSVLGPLFHCIEWYWE